MRLCAYNQIGLPDELVIWVGVSDSPSVPPATFCIKGDPPQLILPRNSSTFFQPLGDQVRNAAGELLNYFAIFMFDWPATTKRFTVEITCGDQRCAITSRRLPACIPGQAEGGFNLLLSSCYYEPNDREKSPLARRIAAIKPKADLTLLAGDQVYLDLPSQQNLPTVPEKLASVLGRKYRDNWFGRNPRQRGLNEILAHGPIVCLPDHHEYWNNFPFRQVQLNNTYAVADRKNWGACARQLYQNYQMAGVQKNGFLRWDIAPLSMLFLDTRSARDDQGECMFTDATITALTKWKEDLLFNKQQGKPTIGLLSSGQALMIEAAGWPDKYLADMEMPNYKDFAVLKNTVEDLISAGIPVIYITGDVHWGRIIEGSNQLGKKLFYEVIASPARPIDSAGTDQWRDLCDWGKGLFGKREDFPRHCDAPNALPSTKLAGLNFSIVHRQRGDHVAMLSFCRTAVGVDMRVDFHCTYTEERLQQK